MLLPRNAAFERAGAIGRTYDEIYSEHSAVWEDQGRTPDLLRYLSQLSGEGAPRTILEIGCGEGFLLAQLPGDDKYAVDVSAQALVRVRARTAARVSVALAERLPFPNGFLTSW